MPNRRHRLLATVLVLLVWGAASTAAFGADAPKLLAPTVKEPAKPDEPAVVKLAIHPARPPAAALAYPLLPRFVELNAGNAVPLYLKAVAIAAERKDPADFWEKVDHWLETPLDKLPRSEIRQAINAHSSELKLINQATHREQCDWQPPVRDDPDVFGILLPEIQHLRTAGRLLALRARLEIAEGHPIEALKTLQTGYALARHTSDCPFLVSSLVGLSISASMDEQMLAIAQAPKSPNLYWSLTALPAPIIDLRNALGLEADSLFLAFPQLRDIEHAKHTPAEWDAILVRFAERWGEMSLWVTSHRFDLATSALMSARAMTLIGKAKDDLVAAGRDRERVNSMPTSQIILLDTVMIYQQTRDDMFKWFNLPYWQARAGFLEADNRLKTEVRDREIIPLASLLMPALQNVRRAMVKSERRIALLRVIEGLRFYAADHDGKLPDSLDAITEVPLPVDPVFGKPFAYRLVDGKATLDAPPPSGESWEMLGTRYEITVAEKP